MLSEVHLWIARRHALCVALCLAGLGPARNARARTSPEAGSSPSKPARQPTASFETFRETASAPVFDDLEGLLKRGKIRVAVTYSKTHYFVDKGRQRGFA